MTAAKILLLVGLFAVPAALLWLGHRFRDRGALARGVFWGGVTGHSLALVPMLVAAHWPPVAWGAAGSPRAWLVYGALAAGAIIGAAAGALLARMGGRTTR